MVTSEAILFSWGCIVQTAAPAEPPPADPALPPSALAAWDAPGLTVPPLVHQAQGVVGPAYIAGEGWL